MRSNTFAPFERFDLLFDRAAEVLPTAVMDSSEKVPASEHPRNDRREIIALSCTSDGITLLYRSRQCLTARLHHLRLYSARD